MAATIALWILGTLLGLYVLFAELLDTIGRLEIIEKRWPPVWRAMSNRPFRLALLLFLLVLLAKDLSERWHANDPASLTVTVPAPPAPIVNFGTASAPPKPQAPSTTPEWTMSASKELTFVAGANTAPSMFRVVVAMDDQESFRFGTEISALLEKAGWRESSEIARTPWAGRFQGVTIHVSTQRFQAASDLQSDFRANGLEHFHLRYIVDSAVTEPGLGVFGCDLG
jgi:hypothetical protein